MIYNSDPKIFTLQGKVIILTETKTLAIQSLNGCLITINIYLNEHAEYKSSLQAQKLH